MAERLFRHYLIDKFLAVEEVLAVLQRRRGDILQGLTGEEGLMGGDDDVWHHQKQSQVVVVDHTVGMVLIEEFCFLFVYVETRRAHLV